jgi:hypothetical protein
MGPKSTLIDRFARSRAPQLAVGLVLVLFIGVVWWPFSDASELEEMTVKRRAGRVIVLRAGETIEVKDETSLQPRDVVHTQSSGEAMVRLQGSRLLTLAPESKIRVDDHRSVDSQGGSILATTEDPLTVSFGDVEVTSSNAAFRLDRGVSAARVASYRGFVTLSSPGDEGLRFGPLFQVEHSVSLAAASAAPYKVDAADPWDRLYLDEVISLQEELDQLASGLSAQIGNQRPGLDYFSALARGRDVSFVRPYLRRDPVNLLVGFTIAQHDAKRTLAGSFRQAFSLYDRGAEWGVAAAILHVKLNRVLADLEDIATVAVVTGADGGASFTAATAAQSATGQIPAPPGDDPGPPGDPTNAPPTNPPTNPPTSDPTKPPDECENFADCLREDVEEEVQPSPSPTPKPTDDPEGDGPLDVLGSGGLLD